MFAIAKSLIAVAFAASTAMAANVPVFSASDDYDEVNLNIRLLAKHNATDDGEGKPTKVIGELFLFASAHTNVFRCILVSIL